jgi:hypothetical protein
VVVEAGRRGNGGLPRDAMTAARRRHESALARDERVAAIGAEDEFAGKFPTRGLDDAASRIEPGDGGFRKEFGSGGLRFAAEPVVEQISGDGARAALGRSELVLIKEAAFAVDVESGEFAVRQRGVGFGQAQLFPDVPRGGVDAVAADFGAGKSGAVEQRDAMAFPCKHKRGEGTGGRCANDDDVVGRHG